MECHSRHVPSHVHNSPLLLLRPSCSDSFHSILALLCPCTSLGVKGSDCQKITERINEALGEVISSQPTEEMFEQEIQIDQTLTNSNVENSGSGDSWDGASSW